MSLEHTDRPIHFPADADKFQFDKEVAAIFPDMARRAIPNFYESHAAHARMLRKIVAQRNVSILDIGASRGAFFEALVKEYGPDRVAQTMELNALDSSAEMT